MLKKHLIVLIFLGNCALSFAQNYDYKIVPLPTNDIIVAPIQKRIYASVPSSIPKYGNSICRINPFTTAIESSVWVGSEPSKLAISDDEKFLYIAFRGTSRLKKLNLLTNQIEHEIITIPEIGRNAYDIAVMPQHPNTYVISSNNLTVMDGTKKRTKTIFGYNEGTSFFFTADTTTAWIVNEGTWHKLKIDSAGVTRTLTVSPQLGNGKNLHYSKYDSLYYADDGYRFDLRSGTPVGRQFASSPGYSLADPLNPNIYYFSFLNEGVELKIYNRKTLVPLDQFTIPVKLIGIYPIKAINWGGSGQMALTGFNEIIIFNPCTSTAPKPSITEGVRVNVCANSTQTLTASGNAARYYWSTGDSTKTIKVTKVGTYTVGVADAAGCVNFADATTLTTIYPPSTPDIYLLNYDEKLCLGSVAKLSTTVQNDGNRYEWSTGQVGQTINVSQASVLTVVAISPNGCRSAPSQPYNLKFIERAKPPKPSIKFVGDTAYCGNLNKKTVLNAPTGYAEYKWSTTQTTQSITTSPTYTQSYSVKVADADGCQSVSSDTLTIRVKETPYKPSVSNIGTTMSVFYTTGVQWFLNGVAIAGATNRIYTATKNGFYTAQITSAEGCVSDMSNWVNITTFTSVNNLTKEQKFDAFPNPTNAFLTINTEGVEQATVSLTDTYGRTVWTFFVKENSTTVSTTDLPSGMYLLGLKDAKGRVLSVKKIVKL
jgi:Secretion system C-terminal sorting domain